MEFKLKVSPSLLAADYGYLADAAIMAEKGGAEAVHVDYMDGHYVPNISFGLELIPALRSRVSIPLVAHLMISNTAERLEDFIKTRPDYIVIQEDVQKDLKSVVTTIRKSGIKPGVAINPDRPLNAIYDVLPDIDLLIVLSVFPGFGGQKFMPDTLHKMEQAHNFRMENQLHYDLGVDGGVNMETSRKIVKTGANVLIAGTA
ncbi:MAG: ribulose-phosphate 3-epimerase, partial [Spirochaetota bacterium]